jgi:hypothetical protein
MAKDSSPNLFSRLTSLFRSGPVIKRSVKDFKQQTGPGQTLSAYEMFRKNHSSVYSSAMSAYGTYDRLARYSDFSEMDYYPEINSALDIYSEEVASPGVDGQILSVYSENKDIERLLNELFFDTLNVNFNLTAWVRNLCKYGDFCLFNDVHPGNGILNVIPIPVNEIEREENYDPKDPMAVRYRWVTQGNTPLENWQVTHFRLLGNDAFLPYGSSVLEGARRVWRQLVLAEDAMLVYRVVRSPDRRVFYIDVGNVPPEEVPMYMEQAQAALKKSQVVDKNTGRVDMRYNPMPVHHGTPVPLLDGTTPTIAEISRRMAADPSWTPWVYSVQDGTKRVVPGKVVWCGKNYTADRLIRVWLDDGTHVTTAPEHPFVMRDGTSRRADELQAGESLMSAYRDLNNRGYERVMEPNGERNSTHVIVARDVHKEMWDTTSYRVVHHRHPERGPSNKRNNSPNNLEVMNFWEHRAMHARHCELTLNRPELLEERRVRRIKFNRSPEKRLRTADMNRTLGKAKRMGAMYNGSDLHTSHNAARRDAQLQIWSVSKDTRKEAMQWIIPNEVVAFVFDTVKKNAKAGREEITEAIRNNEALMEILKAANAGNKRNTHKFHVNAVVNKLHRMGCISSDKFGPFRSFAWANPAPVNHQVTRVEVIEGASDDVYCMTVVGSRGEDDRHNFAVNSLGEQNGLKSLIFLRNSVDEDYFIPVRGGESGTKIDTLSGGTNAAAIEDVQYIQKKLFAALKIPKAYLGYDESIGSKATLSQEDIRFSRTIARIQRTVIAELNKLAIIHLYSNGFDGDELLDFTLQLPNPSTIAQQQKLDLYGTRFDIVAKAPEGYFDKRWLRKNLLGLTDEQIEEIEEGRVKDKLRELELEKVQAETEGGGMTPEPTAPTGAEIGAGIGGEPPPPPPSAPPEGGGAPPEAAGGALPGGAPPEAAGPTALDEFQFKISDEEAPVRAQGMIDRSMRSLSSLPVVLSEARKARSMKKGETPKDLADRLKYNAKRRKPGGILRASVDHSELVKHDSGDERDAITHPYGEKRDHSPSLKDLTPTLDEGTIRDIDEVVSSYTKSITNDLNATLRSLRAGLPKGEKE